MKEKKHKAKKSLGQNFLKSRQALWQIIEAGEIKPDDIVLEIGPGRGALTEKLLKSAERVIAVEKDRKLFEFLQEKFKKEVQAGSLMLVYKDIMNFELENYKLRSYKLIANIPYNITGAILKKFLTDKNQPEDMVLMVQHEVAKRIIATDKKESILSVSVKMYGNPKMIMKVSARYFSPAPKVDSAIIAIKSISRKIFQKNKINEEKFWELVKTGFAHKRKKLSGNLRGVIDFKKSNFQQLSDKRAENLSLSDWISLAQAGQ